MPLKQTFDGHEQWVDVTFLAAAANAVGELAIQGAKLVIVRLNQELSPLFNCNADHSFRRSSAVNSHYSGREVA
jgi:hypothetical protein